MRDVIRAGRDPEGGLDEERADPGNARRHLAPLRLTLTSAVWRPPARGLTEAVLQAIRS